MKRTVALVACLLAGAALMLRWPGLDQRPMHNDEAVNAVKFGRLWQEGAYRYDPNEHHGPSLYYATAAFGRLTGAPDYKDFSETRMRLVTVLFGAGLLLLLPLVADGLGRKAAIWAGIFTVASPAVSFYSRYYIHEVLLVFFTFLALAAGWRYWRSRKRGWAILAGAALGLMHGTKETFVITLGCATLALFLNHTWNRVIDASGPPAHARTLDWRHIGLGLGTWVAVALLLFSSFLTNAAGPLDSIRTYLPWLQRAGGESPHIHPWTFYLERLLFFHPGKGPAWSEAIIFLLAIAGGSAGFLRKGLAEANASFVRFLAVYTFLLTAVYSLLPYKTPWCLLNFWHGAILLAGVGAAVLVEAVPRKVPKIAVAGVLLVGIGHLVWQAWQLDHVYPADRRNPYVYAQTSPNVLQLVQKVERIADSSASKRDLTVKVMAVDGDYWPLPYYLRRLNSVGWWDTLPTDPFAPIMIVSARFGAALDERKTHLMVGYFELRPGVFLELYVELELWKTYLAKNPPVRDNED